MRAVVTRVSSASVTQFSDLYTPFALPFLFSSKEQSFDYFDYWESVPRIRKLCATSWLRRSAICGSLRMKTEK